MSIPKPLGLQKQIRLALGDIPATNQVRVTAARSVYRWMQKNEPWACRFMLEAMADFEREHPYLWGE